jgi:hypothetical protein
MADIKVLVILDLLRLILYDPSILKYKIYLIVELLIVVSFSQTGSLCF